MLSCTWEFEALKEANGVTLDQVTEGGLRILYTVPGIQGSQIQATIVGPWVAFFRHYSFNAAFKGSTEGYKANF